MAPFADTAEQRILAAPTGRPRLVVVQHAACEPLGTLEPELSRRLAVDVFPAYGDPVAYRHAVADLLAVPDAPPEAAPAYDGLLLLGGPTSVYDHAEVEGLDDSIRLAKDALHRGLPVLGICLGAQIVAWALGALVVAGRTQGRRKEIGWFPVSLTERGAVDPLFHGFAPADPVLHWHGDTFALPAGAWHLASSEAYPHQAFRHGRWTYGLQFHVEMTTDIVAECVDAYADELAGLDHVEEAAVVAQSAEHAPAMVAKAETVARHFAECVETAYSERSRR